MHIVWSKYIKSSNLWEPEYFGVFSKLNNEITYFFKEYDNVFALSEKNNEPRIIYSCFNGVRLSLPRKWTIVENNDNVFLLFSESQTQNVNILSQIRIISIQKVLTHNSICFLQRNWFYRMCYFCL